MRWYIRPAPLSKDFQTASSIEVGQTFPCIGEMPATTPKVRLVNNTVVHAVFHMPLHNTLLPVVLILISKWLAAFLLVLLHNHHGRWRCWSQILRCLKDEGLQGTAFVVRLLHLFGDITPVLPWEYQQSLLSLLTYRREYIYRQQSAEVGFWDRCSKLSEQLCVLLMVSFGLGTYVKEPYKLRELSL